ncbi:MULTISPECIES: Rpn family recombination-promoting nuclease/putative transposase [Butyricimonas]|uniref:Rpn family recombination-promoting nuclease/putative transposase n=1 Tax=Butyricimonas TaxID=574697 RepID=UPI001D072225|nr:MULTISPECIES: Rpn family recombination-promoting nuclease/putative transposase [Butyricimonas]MCB6974781.1 Rpn family recombination-promoting nuclease/putative transposase [Butyricimonas synergistica]MCG4521523.1 Rpn family recombination-promoting nuclease/putative transposase [Butyricimonas sp. DFI.6.44]
MGIDYLKERYVNPYTDFGFKRLFGNEISKDLLISFLNALLHEEQHIVDITYLRNEHLGVLEKDRKAVFDVYCENDKGEKFIVEMQKAEQQFFKDRSVFYSTFPIREQALRGEWDYKLKAVYTIGILNFVFDENREDENYYHHEIKLMDINKKEVFYDKLTFIYLEMPKFTKTETELETLFDKWMYVLKNLPRLMERPVALQERIFERVFRVAEIAKFNKNELVEYEESLKVFRDLNNVINTAEQKGETRGEARGRAEGRAEGERKKALDIARNLKSSGLPVEDIAKFTGLTLKEISNL